jgi:hypothetical protein
MGLSHEMMKSDAASVVMNMGYFEVILVLWFVGERIYCHLKMK